MKARRLRAAIPSRKPNQDFFARCLRIFDENIKIAAIVKDAGIGQFKFGIETRAPATLIGKTLVGKLLLRILVQRLHVGVARRVVEIEVTLFYIFPVIPLGATQPEQPFFDDRIAAIPHRDGEADELMTIAESEEAIFVPAISARARLIVREIVPRIAVCAVVFAHGSPCAFAQVRSPSLPIDFVSFVLKKAFVFFAHEWPGRRTDARPRAGSSGLPIHLERKIRPRAAAGPYLSIYCRCLSAASL